MAEKIEFDLSVKNNQLSDALEDAAKKSSSLQRALETTAGVVAGNVLTGAFNKLTGSIAGFARESVKAFSDQEDAINRLSQSLRASGSFSEAAVDDFAAYATELQKTTLFTDEVVISQLALAKSLGATNKQAKELVTAASELSATFGGDLESNVLLLGKSLSGALSRELSRLVPELKGLSAEALRSGEAIALINERFGGAAAAQLDTYSGRLAQLNKAFGEFQESIGRLIVNSGIQTWFETYGQVIDDVTQAINDSQIAADRQKGGYRETQESVAQLTRQINELKVEVIDAEQIVNNPSLFDQFLNRPQVASENIARLNKEIAALEAQLKTAQESVAASQASAPQEQARPEVRTEQAINQQRELQAQLRQLDAQFAAEQKAFQDQLNAEEIENTRVREEAKLLAITEQKLAENEAIYQAEVEKAKIIEDSQNRQLALSVAYSKKKLADEKVNSQKEIEIKRAQVRLEQDILNTRLAAAQGFLSAAISLSKDGSREQKALQSASAVVSTYTAANQALSSPPGPPYTLPLVAATIAQGLANVARINSVKFEKGGFVGGVSGATTGPDNTTAQIREGEMILNADQQRNLLNIINGGSATGDIVVQINSREIARAVRDEVRGGFKL